jgi:hypothetical protein
VNPTVSSTGEKQFIRISIPQGKQAVDREVVAFGKENCRKLALIPGNRMSRRQFERFWEGGAA